MSGNKYHGVGGYPGAGGGPYVTYGYSGPGDHEGPVIQIHRGHSQPAEAHLPGQTAAIEMGRCHWHFITINRLSENMIYDSSHHASTFIRKLNFVCCTNEQLIYYQNRQIINNLNKATYNLVLFFLLFQTCRTRCRLTCSPRVTTQ